ncbi:TFIIA-alpha and beta-like factor [Denticeps clupeoides]|uniref:TFIIA-alpha and beta-like factor n=1 Tax=Denticeps clupeoides TaxID=299321 RepID=UPI0010A49A2A|nr:TFIIA-alpha and beta-like factor [Denticeps clupeoides]
MLSSANVLPKLYLSVIDDVIEGLRETFLEEGVEEVLEDLRQRWEAKVTQSKAVEGFTKDAINPSNFVLQLPASYAEAFHKPTASVVIPAGHTVQSFTAKPANPGAIATFSLPPGVTYPVHIPAGVTLQTASGHFYKVNVPVVVTQGPGGNRATSQPKVQAVQPAAFKPPPPQTAAAPSKPPGQSEEPRPPTAPVPDSPGEFTLEGIEFSPQPLDMSLQTPPAGCPAGTPAKSEETRLLGPEVEEDAEKAAPVPDLDSPLEEAIKRESLRDYNYNELADIVQLDGPCGGSSDDEDEGGADAGVLGENEFLGMINADALEALQEAGDSGDDGSSASSSGSEKLEDIMLEEEDPLNSGDDVSEQDVPDLFDTDNVIVCQYDKIHRSKNRWKFYLKDGVMSFRGKDYVFSKAVGEAEW